jgi:replication factor C small subunit
LPSKPIISILAKLGGKVNCNWRYKLRHQLYFKKSSRVSKKKVNEILEHIDNDTLSHQEKILVENLRKLSRSDIFAVKIKNVKIRDYDGFVFDVSVPESEMFWGGTVPILLHNSDERGIDVIRHKVKEFARARPIGGVPFRIIILDEADALTQDAQQALRRTMESYTNVSRFILICNWSSKIIEPIQSRCAVFRFRSLSEDDIKTYINRIADKEKIKITNGAINSIIEITEGDLRKVSNLMQSAASLGGEVTDGVVFDAANRAKPNDVREMVKLALAGNFGESRKLLQELLLKQGLSGGDILSEIHRQIYSLDIPEEVKIKLIDKCGEYDFRISEGGNELIQIEAFLAQITLYSR